MDNNMGAYYQAFRQLAPDAKISFAGGVESYETVQWKSDTPCPDKESVENLVKELQPAWDKWEADRKSAYSTVEEQLDMLWRSMELGEIPGKGSRWHEHIRQAKANTPKPE